MLRKSETLTVPQTLRPEQFKKDFYIDPAGDRIWNSDGVTPRIPACLLNHGGHQKIS